MVELVVCCWECCCLFADLIVEVFTECDTTLYAISCLCSYTVLSDRRDLKKTKRVSPSAAQQYTVVNKDIRKKIKEAKEKWPGSPTSVTTSKLG